MQTFVVRCLVPMPLLCLALALAACHRSDPPARSVRHYQVRGIVRGFAPDRSTIHVEHEAIPGFMPSMTMPFTPREPKDIASLTLRDAIAFRLAVTDKDALIDNIRKIAPSEVHLPQTTTATTPQATNSSSRLKEGDMMPAFGLTNENGEGINGETYGGRPFVITFIFVRCPMPNFCPRMAKNFGELQRAIKSGSGALAETKLLSITIDPQNDTPAVLKEYGQAEGADPQTWNFATAEPAEIASLTTQFAVQVTPEGGTISHGLATALIGRDGRIVKLWRGNGWTPEEVIAAISASL
jgi:protein SCO1/2